ncbi:MAG: hypothetical protein KC910_21735 [Candidatus Eremiobacteraeota bacterium]|nr:hypothetical protein [Candidatus Eremiobacteraeota bacterium]
MNLLLNGLVTLSLLGGPVYSNVNPDAIQLSPAKNPVAIVAMANPDEHHDKDKDKHDKDKHDDHHDKDHH